MADTYILPCSPSVLCEDRLSALDSDELEVPFWAALKAILNARINSAGGFVELLETVAITRNGRTNTDYGFLKNFMSQELRDDFYENVWPRLVDIALSMPGLFPSHSLPICTPQHPSLELSRRQTACLIIHQFLCTLAPPTWQDGYQDFHIWYSTYQPHERVVTAYLISLFTYFKKLTNEEGFSPLDYDQTSWPICYSLRTNDTVTLDTACSLCDVATNMLPEATTDPTVLGLSGGAATISANKFIGFGQTGTQEETHVGASPECCPAVLVTPPLGDNQAQIVRGPEAMISISGYGRDARCGEVLRHQESPAAHCKKWSSRTMVFIDALELDVESHDHGLPDLLPGKIAREIKKAFIGFSAGQSAGTPLETIFTGYWGCRTFGGNPYIKTILQWCAASLARSARISFILSTPEQHKFGKGFEEFIRSARGLCENRADRLISTMLSLEPTLGGDPSIFDHILRLLRAGTKA